MLPRGENIVEPEVEEDPEVLARLVVPAHDRAGLDVGVLLRVAVQDDRRADRHERSNVKLRPDGEILDGVLVFHLERDG